jgi:sulfoxide reductase catalytic subunit YedY
MIIRKQPDLRYSEVTPKHEYLSRRQLLSSVAAGAIALQSSPVAHAAAKLSAAKSKWSTDEKLTPYDAVTGYNNFYEFGTAKNDPSERAKNFRTSPWKVVVEGAVAKPRVFDLDEIMKLAPLEERIYRMRCVEAWSMVIPWIGISLNTLIKQVEPTAKAKYVAFQSFYDPKQMLGTNQSGIAFPYVEGLRMDEAMHPLTLLCSGLYGEVLPNQNGAPLRIVVPWKYGFKSIKSIAKIRFVEKEPPTTWNISNSREYGFYSNVNPEVEHPRWSQARERRLGEFAKRETLKFNGYGDQVAGLYSGMDLRRFY